MQEKREEHSTYGEGLTGGEKIEEDGFAGSDDLRNGKIILANLDFIFSHFM